MKNLFLIFLLLNSFYIAMAKEFSLFYYGYDLDNTAHQLNHDLNKNYRSVIRQLPPVHQNQFTHIQEKWMRYLTLHCANSTECKNNATSIQIKNLNALISKKTNMIQSESFVIQYDTEGEITTHSFDTISDLMQQRYERELNQLNYGQQKEYLRSYEIYHAYLFDYCELLNHITHTNFNNCTIQGLIDFQYHVKH